MNTKVGGGLVYLLIGFLLGIGAPYVYQSILQGSAYRVEETGTTSGKGDNAAKAPASQTEAEGGAATDFDSRERQFRQMLDAIGRVNGSSVYNIKVCQMFDGYIREYLGGYTNVKILEIGPGINLGTGLVFAMYRAQKYYGLDIYKDPSLYDAPHYENVAVLLNTDFRDA